MSLKNTLLSFCALTASFALPAYAEVNFDVDIGTAPPPAQVEVVPTVAPGIFGYQDIGTGKKADMSGFPAAEWKNAQAMLGTTNTGCNMAKNGTLNVATGNIADNCIHNII